MFYILEETKNYRRKISPNNTIVSTRNTLKLMPPIIYAKTATGMDIIPTLLDSKGFKVETIVFSMKLALLIVPFRDIYYNLFVRHRRR